MSRFSVEIFCLTVPKHFVVEPFCAAFQESSGNQKILEDKRGWEYRAFLSKNFCLTVLKNLVGEAFFGASRKISGSKKSLWIRRTRKYQNFPSKLFFRLTVPKFFERTLLCCVSEKFRQLKSLWIRGVGVSNFSVENFSSDNAEKFRRGNRQCVINFGYRKILCFRWLCNDFLSKTFCLTVPEHFAEEPFCAAFQESSGS